MAAAPAPTAEPDGDEVRASQPRLAPRDDCRRKGITPERGVEGTCFRESGRRVEVVDKTTTLDLPELSASLASVDVAERRIENAVDVTIDVEITSKVAGEVDIAAERFGMHIGSQLFVPDGVVNAYAENGLLARGVRLGEGDKASGAIVFRLPIHLGARIGRDAELWIAQFSDFSPKSASRTIGAIRLYE